MRRKKLGPGELTNIHASNRTFWIQSPGPLFLPEEKVEVHAGEPCGGGLWVLPRPFNLPTQLQKLRHSWPQRMSSSGGLLKAGLQLGTKLSQSQHNWVMGHAVSTDSMMQITKPWQRDLVRDTRIRAAFPMGFCQRSWWADEPSILQHQCKKLRVLAEVGYGQKKRFCLGFVEFGLLSLPTVNACKPYSSESQATFSWLLARSWRIGKGWLANRLWASVPSYIAQCAIWRWSYSVHRLNMDKWRARFSVELSGLPSRSVWVWRVSFNFNLADASNVSNQGQSATFTSWASISLDLNYWFWGCRWSCTFQSLPDTYGPRVLLQQFQTVQNMLSVLSSADVEMEFRSDKTRRCCLRIASWWDLGQGLATS